MAVILIVEDEADLLALFQTVLRRHAQTHEIITANGGQAAIEFLREQTPSVAILDIAMPHVSGNDVIHYILSEPRLDSMQVIVVSAVPMRLSEEGTQRAAAVFSKPVTPRELEKAVTELLKPMAVPSTESYPDARR